MKTKSLKNTHTHSAFFVADGARLVGPNVPGGKPVAVPKKLTPGADYAVYPKGKSYEAVKLTTVPKATAVGGFHVGLNGQVAVFSIWDTRYRPACPDPRGMVRVPGVGWVDIYLLNTDPQKHGTSAAGQQIADGYSDITLPKGGKRRLTWFVATSVLEHHGKQLLTPKEFELAMEGSTENKACGKDPVKTGHAEGLKSRWGIEQATGCMYVWSRSVQDVDGCMYILGGYWNSGGAGPRRWDSDRPGGDWSGLAARGRCDHLIPDGSEAKA